MTPRRPTVLTVDDDPDVLRTIERDLRRHRSIKRIASSVDDGSIALQSVHRYLSKV